MRVLVVNAGSSSLKLSLVDPDAPDDAAAEAARSLDPGDEDGLRAAVGELGARADAVGHRVVHGGPRLAQPVRLDGDVRAELAALADLAPLHQPPALAGIDLVADVLGDLEAVCCFDTAFHATIEPAARTYAVPRAWREEHGVRLYGFHGLSHAWVASQVGPGRVVSCHLGSGASACAIRDGRSVATTMGFTPADGLVMASRAGRVDPGALVHLVRAGLDAEALEEGLERSGGLLALAGTQDLAEVLDRARDGDDDAVLAREVMLHRLRGAIGELAAALGGVDVLAFTGGAGEASAELRARTAEGLGFLGVALDPQANASASADATIGAPGAGVRTVVVTAREDVVVARATRDALA